MACKGKQGGRRTRSQNRNHRTSEPVTWLFVCEGETECNYVKSLVAYANSKSNGVKIKAITKPAGKTSKELMNHAVKIDEYDVRKDIDYERVFVLFDLDFDPDKPTKTKNFDKAVGMGGDRYTPIWSNDCFELWFIFHFECLRSDIGRKQYAEKLKNHLGVEQYDKTADIFSLIHKDVKTALCHAGKRNIECSDKLNPSEKVACTQMFVLIKSLENRLKFKF